MVDRDESASLPLGADTGTRSVQTRRHNLSVVLTHLHHSGPLTRAELTRLGCDLGQGHALSPALAGPQVAEWWTRRVGNR